MMPLDSIRRRNAVKFVVTAPDLGAPYSVGQVDDRHCYDVACQCNYIVEAQVIASLLTDYAARCAARNVPLWDNALTRREAILAAGKRKEEEDEVTLDSVLEDIKAKADAGMFDCADPWPKDKGYEAWRNQKERMKS